MEYMNPKNWYNGVACLAKHGSKLLCYSNSQNGTKLIQLSDNRGSTFIRIAGLSGALAVGLAAYGAHVLMKEKISDERKVAFENAKFQHYTHTLALLAVPLTRKPYLVGTLLTTGMLLFCGGAYTYAFTDNPIARRVPPFGGITLILAWLSMIL